jgi:hypothetical protein
MVATSCPCRGHGFWKRFHETALAKAQSRKERKGRRENETGLPSFALPALTAPLRDFGLFESRISQSRKDHREGNNRKEQETSLFLFAPLRLCESPS